MGSDEAVAHELEQSADRAQRRGGLAAAAAFLERAAALTPNRARQARGELAAAQAKQRAGAFDAALGLLAAAQAGPLDALGNARVELLRAQTAFAVSRGSDAPTLLLSAARRLEPLDAGLARETYLDAFLAAVFADRLADRAGALEIAVAARAAPPAAAPPSESDLLLDGLATLVTAGHDAAGAALGRALIRWDYDNWAALCGRQLELARDAGALSLLPNALSARVAVHLFAGEPDAVAALGQEVDTVADAIASRIPPYAGFASAAWRGREADTVSLVEAGALERLTRTTGAASSDWGLGIEARSRALVSEGEAAEPLYLEAIERLGRAGVRAELARACLLYGEWLRRARRRLDAREQLRTAHDLFGAMDMDGFAARAARELLATGETARKRAAAVAARDDLTAQEAQIARLARDGHSNPEIGARLFISPRTVEYHLQGLHQARHQRPHAVAGRARRRRRGRLAGTHSSSSSVSG